MILKQLIVENKFEELKQALQVSNAGLRIHIILFRILNNENPNQEDYGFEANIYQEEFLEGFDLYKSLNNSKIAANYLQVYRDALTFLAYKMGGFIKLLADTTMRQGLYLSRVENVFKLQPTLRDELQLFIGLLREINDVKAVANIAAAKAQISLSFGDLLVKYQIGMDMLQFALSYEEIGLKEEAIQVYRGILRDFESESVKLSTELFPQADTRPKEEIDIFDNAKMHYERLTGEEINDVKKVHVNDSIHARKLVDKVLEYDDQMMDGNGKNSRHSFLERVRRFFK